MLIGAHVSSSGGITRALERGQAIGAEAIQVFTQSPRTWRAPRASPEDLDGARRDVESHPSIRFVFCHAIYLVNLVSPDAETAQRSEAALVAGLEIATAIGSSGVVVHVGSHRGEAGDHIERAAGAIARALDAVPGHCPLLLENAAGAGGTIGRSLEELASLLDLLGGSAPAGAVGVCIDTQHLWASGVGFRDVGEAGKVVAAFDDLIGLDRVACLHLNDSKVPFGCNRDRHENLGAGTIGSEALAALVGHPRLEGVPAILEVPGTEGKGPGRADVEGARRILAQGRQLWRDHGCP